MKTRPEIETFNALVQELDEATEFAFDRITDVPLLAKVASVWPGTRLNLADDLRAAHLSLILHDAFRPLFEKLLTTETVR